MHSESIGLRDQILKEKNWDAVKADAPPSNRVQFLLARDFDKASKVLAWKFIRDFSEEYGLEVEPIMIGSGCVSIEIRVESSEDRYGRKLSELFAHDVSYRELFNSYDVTKIVMRGFPEMERGQPPFLNISID